MDNDFGKACKAGGAGPSSSASKAGGEGGGTGFRFSAVFQRDLRQVSVATFNETSLDEQRARESGDVCALEDSEVWVSLDTGADEHVAPPWFGSEVEFKTSAGPYLEAAGGHKIKHYGERTVTVMVGENLPFTTTYQIMDVKEPIISLGKFHSGHPARSTLLLGRNGTMMHENGAKVELKKRNQHYVIPARVTAGFEIGAQGTSASTAWKECDRRVLWCLEEGLY